MQGMRDLLRSSLGRSLSPLPPLDRLAAAWPVACGPALAAHGELTAYDRGTLTVFIAEPDWLQPLAHMRAVLLSDLARIAAVPLTAIHFETAADRQKAERAAQKAAFITSKPAAHRSRNR